MSEKSVLELNIKAKKQPVVIEVPNNNGVQLEVGKKYITNEGVIVGPMEAHTELTVQVRQGEWTEAHPKPQGSYIYKLNGCYLGAGLDYPRSIRREWHPSWKEEEAWMAGKRVEVLMDGVWYLITTPFQHVCTLFGADSNTTKTWWHTHTDITFKGQFLTRIVE